MSEKSPQDTSESLEKWRVSARAWITDQGELGDWSRRAVLDPALEKILPDVRGKMVLDLGCGEGRYSRVLRDKGAHVVGIDPVPEFVDQARRRDAKSTYIEAVAEQIPLGDETFDMVLSYLSLVDIPDLASASREICRLLKPHGELIIVNISNLASATEGWVKDEQGRKTHRTVDRYMEHFSLDIEWRNIQVRNFHRPLSYILGLFLDNGFVLTKFVEPLPMSTDPNYPDEFRAPNFQIFSLLKMAKPGSGMEPAAS